MATLHVGGLNPIRRYKTLKDAIAKAKADDVIELHKNIEECITIDKPLQINGNNNIWRIPSGKLGIDVDQTLILKDTHIVVQSRANALLIKKRTTLDNVCVSLKGPLVEIYPAIWITEGAKHLFKNCVLTKVVQDEDTDLTLDNCDLYSYYGANIETASRSECSSLYGNVTINGGSVTSTTLHRTKIKNTTIGKFVNVEDAELTNIVFSENVPERASSLMPSPKRLKKEPSHGPLSEQTGNNYHLYGTGNITINGYSTKTKDDTATGFYFNNVTVNITNVNNPQERLTHIASRSGLSFANTNDQNYWKVDNTTVQLVKSQINSNSKQETAMKKLDKLIGLKNVKSQLRSILNSITVGKTKGFSNHMIFAGEAGTGKTTVAKIAAQALFEVGAVPENKCTFATVDTLIKGYIGQTAANVREILDGARGGVLFIDEAYQLTVKEGDKTFNDEAISVLIRYMEDYRDDLVVIAAGYSKEMREFLASNTGLTRRFQWVEFDDYTPEEMGQIFELMRQDHDDVYADDVDPRIITPLFAKLTDLNLSRPDANGRVTNGGNGGLVRNVYQRIVQTRNDRYVEEGGDMTIQKSDIVKGFEKEIRQTLAKTNP